MTGEFDADVFGGAGRPSNAQVLLTRDYLKRHERNHSLDKVIEELKARGFSPARSTVGRVLKADKEGKSLPEPEPKIGKTKGARQRTIEDRRARRDNKPPHEKKDAPPNPALEFLRLPEDTVRQVVTLASLIAAENTSTKLAIDENRARMALNTVLMHHMAARPELMLLDMRGTASLIDALTMATKLSGGAAIDITVANPGREQPHGAVNGVTANGHEISPNGHAMKDVTPVRSPLSDELEHFRRKRAMGNGERA